MQVLKCDYLGNSLVAQQLKDPALSLLRLKLLLWHGFDLWPRNFGMLWMQHPPQKKNMTISLKPPFYLMIIFHAVHCARHWGGGGTELWAE